MMLKRLPVAHEMSSDSPIDLFEQSIESLVPLYHNVDHLGIDASAVGRVVQASRNLGGAAGATNLPRQQSQPRGLARTVEVSQS